MEKGDEGLSSIILAGLGILVKMLITLEPHGICMLIHSNIYLPIGLSELIAGIIVSALLETINLNKAIYNLEPGLYGTYFRTSIQCV